MIPETWLPTRTVVTAESVLANTFYKEAAAPADAAKAKAAA